MDQCAADFGGRPLVLGDDTSLTYDDVVEQSEAMAAGLVALGVRPDDRVAMVMANYAEFVTVRFAISRAGAIAARGASRPGARSVAELAALGRQTTSPAALAIDPHAPADILYTSGTTGTPKGVVTSHDAVLRTAYASALTRAFDDGRRILFSLLCFHRFGLSRGCCRCCRWAAPSFPSRD